MFTRLRNLFKKSTNIENLNILNELLTNYPLRTFDYFSFEKEDEYFKFYFSTHDDVLSLRFIFNEHKELEDFYFHHFKNIFCFSENEIKKLNHDFQELWRKFKTVLTKSRTVQYNMLHKGFLDHESDIEIDPISDEFTILKNFIHKTNVNLFDYFTLDIEDDEYSFYCSYSSVKDNFSLIFTFDKNKKLDHFSFFSKSFIGKELHLSFDDEDIALNLPYFQDIWEQFKLGFKQNQKTRIRMLAEGFY